MLAEVKIEVLLQRGLQVNWMVVARDLLAGTQKMKMGASGASEHGRGWRGEIANRFAIFLCSWDIGSLVEQLTRGERVGGFKGRCGKGGSKTTTSRKEGWRAIKVYYKTNNFSYLDNV